MTTATSRLDYAHKLRERGVSCIPVASNKRPFYKRLPLVTDERTGEKKRSWDPYKGRLPTPDELRRWFEDGRAQVAVVCGAVSGGVLASPSGVAWPKPFRAELRFSDSELKRQAERALLELVRREEERRREAMEGQQR